ncbi:arylamine N-acetyltransferase family protein [Paenibacillus hamazuiensis]|uniref:arylamine N-acetyltransferase family protein n=1 Tax=Paenibacillus hamazuiensis TaxID=2936508 RepID=UPI00200FD6CF|nr:arylamine N-acetyltransferase [Paenibacillus hamazuiensis]
MFSKDEIKAYLNRLGVKDVQEPTKAYLFELHKAHVKHLPWQTVDIFAGKPASMDVRESVRLITSGRSGYCFHLNGAFSTLLRSLGYRVHWHRAGVQPLGEEPRVNSFHLGLTVSLANERSEEERWIIDAGLGDMPYEPIPLKPGVYEQHPFTYQVVESTVAAGGWRLVHDPLAQFAGVDFDPGIVDDLSVFEPKHEFYSKSPDSKWINTFLLRHRHESGSNELRGLMWIKRDTDGIVKTELDTKSRWLEVLADVFGERLVNYSPLERDDIWKKALALHEEWKKSRVGS